MLQDIACPIMLAMRAERPNAKAIGESFDKLCPQQVRKISTGASRPTETSRFKPYIDKVKQDSPHSIAVLIDTMHTDPGMTAYIAQGSVHDGGVAMIECCKKVLRVPPPPVTPPHTPPPPPFQQPVAANDVKTAEADRLAEELDVSGLDDLHGAADASNIWPESTSSFSCDELPSSPRSELAVGRASESENVDVPVRRHCPQVRVFDAPEMPEDWPDEDASGLPSFKMQTFAYAGDR